MGNRRKGYRLFFLVFGLVGSVTGLSGADPAHKGVFVSPSSSPTAQFFWQLERLVAKGEIKEALQGVFRDPQLAKKVGAELIFERVFFLLRRGEEEKIASLSPFTGQVVKVIQKALNDPILKDLWERAEGVRGGRNPYRAEGEGIEGALASFVAAAQTHDFAGRRKRWQRALRQSKEKGIELGEAFCLNELALQEWRERDLSRAFTYWNLAYQLFARWRYQTRQIQVLNRLGVAAYRLGLFERARLFLLSALRLAEKCHDAYQKALVLNSLGILAYHTGVYREAVQNFRQAFELFKTLKVPDRQLSALNNLGVAYKRLRDYEAALRTFQKALDLARKTNDLVRQAFIWNNIGDVYRLLGDLDQALYCLHQSLKVAKDSGNKEMMALAVHSLGIVHQERGMMKIALRWLKKSLELRRALNDSLGQVQTLIVIGVTYAKMKELREARKAFEEAFRLSRRKGYRVGEALALLNIGSTYDDGGDYSRALGHYRQSLRLWEVIGDPWMQAWCWMNMGKAWEAMGDQRDGGERERAWAQAIGAYQRAVELVTSVRARVKHKLLQVEFAPSATLPFYHLADLLAQKGRYEEAFWVAERVRAYALLDALKRFSLPFQNNVPPREWHRYKKLQRQVSALEEKLSEELMRERVDIRLVQRLRQALEEARAALQQWRDKYWIRRFSLLPSKRTYNAFEVSSSLDIPKDLAILAYLVTPERTWLFVLTANREGRNRTELRCFPIKVSDEDLKADVRWFRENLLRRRPVGITAQRLYTLLVAPAAKMISKKRWLCFIPDGPLYGLPFHALQDEKGAYLAEKFTLFYITSLRVLMELVTKTQRRKSQWLWTGLGNPSRSSVAYPPLPFAEKEVKKIAELLKAHERTFIGKRATEKKGWEALQTSRWVHFAAHGLLEPDRPFHSRIVLAPDKKNDGFLRAYEVLEKPNIAAEMVILSGCETGQGKVLRGEGVIGLAWAFFAVGVRTLIVSQWRVDDASTAKLMTSFYQHLLKGLSPAQALRQAQISLLSSPHFRHPYYWAPFITMGVPFKGKPQMVCMDPN